MPHYQNYLKVPLWLVAIRQLMTSQPSWWKGRETILLLSIPSGGPTLRGEQELHSLVIKAARLLQLYRKGSEPSPFLFRDSPQNYL
jgi:hypothetical protein